MMGNHWRILSIPGIRWDLPFGSKWLVISILSQKSCRLWFLERQTEKGSVWAVWQSLETDTVAGFMTLKHQNFQLFQETTPFFFNHKYPPSIIGHLIYQVLLRWASSFYSQPCCYSVTKSCLTLWDPMDCSTPGPPYPVLHHLPEHAQTHVHWVNDAIQPSHPLPPPSPALNLSQHQHFFQWVSSLNQVAKVFSFSTSPSNEYSG